MIQKYLNFHYSVSLDLFGGETSTNVANYFTAGLKGRWIGGAAQGRPPAHRRLASASTRSSTGEIGQTEVAALVGLNTDLRREYIADCQSGVKRWNRILDERRAAAAAGLPHVGVQPPGRRVRRHRGHARTARCSPPSEWERAQGRVAADRRRQDATSRSLMQPVYEPGKIAAWIAPPRQGINGKPFDYEYVHLALRERSAMTDVFNACTYLLDRHVEAGDGDRLGADRAGRRR